MLAEKVLKCTRIKRKDAEKVYLIVAIIHYALRLGGVVVGVLATGPQGCGFEPGQGDGF
jgi:hypothetical protein